MFYVYVLQNPTKKIYIGHTENLEGRIARHNGKLRNKSKSFTSKNSGPWRLVYKESFKTRTEAANREKELKSFRGREYIKKQINQK